MLLVFSAEEMEANTRVQRTLFGPEGSDWAWSGCRRDYCVGRGVFKRLRIQHRTKLQTAAGPAVFRF
ncbi:uncharacterized protein DMAD_13606 [Drosophila madeirensis]|uniref:Uncharacterized protein n=1 Tax=Drosophila madeirensis TaxID=30013 RepID=A0AAU9GFJ6_DROMD